jgi:membrane fusion protein, copper/silver efflux system
VNLESPRTRKLARQLAPFAVLVVVAFLIGRLTGGRGDPADAGEDQVSSGDAAEGTGGEVWTCSMHPQVRQPGPGRCPICAMDLIPVTADDEDDADLPRLSLGPRAMALMEIETAPVIRQAVSHEIRLSGRVDYDETRLHEVVLRAEGEIRRLFLNYRNAPVRRGEHLAEIYSPTVLNAAEELRLVAASGRSERMVEMARRKLSLLGVSPAQINRIARTGEVPDTFTVFSPIDGVLAELSARQGDWVDRGQVVMRIADLSHVWVLLDAYESDLPWLRYGQRVDVTIDAYPGEHFEGTVAFIDPVVGDQSRVARIRVHLPNPEGRLKPGMFARGLVRSPLAAGGRVVEPDLEGKWICPMHPEVVQDGPGRCPLCGMPLVEPSTLGYATADPHGHAPLLIPAAAPLRTGRRAVVYVRDPDADRPTFEAREVILGPRAGDFHLVVAGLEEGEIVVTHGAFKIDSELQIRGRPSMMSAGAPHVDGHDHAGPIRYDVPASFSTAVGRLVQAYLPIAEALAADDPKAAADALHPVRDALAAIDPHGLHDEAASTWKRLSAGVRLALDGLGAVPTGGPDDEATLEALRIAFEPLSGHLEDAVNHFGTGETPPVHRAHCPMAFDDRGAAWLQSGTTIANPYFGASMLRCGTVEGPMGAHAH